MYFTDAPSQIVGTIRLTPDNGQSVTTQSVLLKRTPCAIKRALASSMVSELSCPKNPESFIKSSSVMSTRKALSLATLVHLAPKSCFNLGVTLE